MYHFNLTERIASLRKFTISPVLLAKTKAHSGSSQNRPISDNSTDHQPEDNNTQPENADHEQDYSSTGHTAAAGVVSNSLPHTHVARNVGQFVGQFVSRLPKLTLPTFSGEPLQFQTFWDSFVAAIHNDEGLTGVQKFHYLRAQLQGDAYNVIDNLPLTDLNYEHSVALLKERFGQPYKLVDAHMNALMHLPKPVNSLTSLQNFHDKLESHMRALMSLGKSPDTYSTMLTRMVLGKLPADLRKQFARDNSGGEWTIRDVMACILKEIRVLEIGHYSNDSNKEFHSTAASLHTGAAKSAGQREKREPVCTYCKGSHTANQCTVVTDHQQCTSIVKGAGLCFNCLAHHRVSQCTSRRRCKQCNQKHHTSLCHSLIATTRNPQPPPPSTPQLPPAPVANHIRSVPPPQAPPAASTSALTTVSRPQPPLEYIRSPCLLKTAIATVSAGPYSTEGNILLDEGAQHSFISQDLADRLCLKTTNRERVSLSSFGNRASSARLLQVATISIHTIGQSPITISVLVVPQLAAPLQNSMRMELTKLPYLKGLQLAHPVTEDDNFEINVLVGADYYWTFVQDQVIRGNGPTAVKSHLGYLLSGPLLQPSAAANLIQVNFTAVDDLSLDTFWKTESTGISSTTMDSDNHFLKDYMQSNIKRQPDGALSMKFPWKEDHPPLPSNFSICAKRTRSLAKRLAKTPELLSMYGQIIADQESKGFIERVNDFNTKQSHYIPH